MAGGEGGMERREREERGERGRRQVDNGEHNELSICDDVIMKL